MPRNCRAPAEADPEDYLYPGDLTIGRASEHLSHLSRDRWFESISLQRRVNKLSVPLTTPVVRSHDPSAVERPVGRKGSDRQSAASDVRRSGRSRRTGVWIAAAMAATSGDVVHLLRDCPQCEQRFQLLHLPFQKAPASSPRPSRLIRAPSSEPRRRLRRPFLARRAGSVRAETAVSTVRMQPRGRQRFGALYRGFRARLARGLRELGCSRRSKARSWSANRWNPANVG